MLPSLKWPLAYRRSGSQSARRKTLQLRENFLNHQARRPLIGFNDDIRHLSVERVTNRHQFSENTPRIGRSQQGAVTITRSALQLLLHRRVQVDNPATLANSLAVLGTHHHTTACRQNQAILRAKLSNHSLLALTKALLPLYIEDPGNIRPRTLLDFLIGIFEQVTHFLGQQAPDGAFTSTHRADQNQIGHKHSAIHGNRLTIHDARGEED